MQWCTKCVYPASSAVKLSFDENGVCSGCVVNGEKPNIDWEKRARMLKELVEPYRSKTGGYDILIPVSGGKDSTYQVWYATEVLKLKPLLVTYHGNNYLPIGEYNLFRLRHLFDCDHIIAGPSIPVLKKLNRVGFKLMGDMSWHCHSGIFSFPVQIAVKFKVPLVMWGEHGRLDRGGQYSLYDLVEMSARDFHEHHQRGYQWKDLTDEGLEKLGHSEYAEGLTEHDFNFFKYPTMEEIAEVGIRGIYLGNYIYWDPNRQTEFVMKELGWKPSPEPFERTYRTMSNLDDMHETGIKDYLKYVKFGYGRCSDHVSKDIRLGAMTREEGIELVKKYDHVRSKDFQRWFEYAGMSEEEFDRICDEKFYNQKIWWKDENNKWVKENIWDDEETLAQKKVAHREWLKKNNINVEPA